MSVTPEIVVLETLSFTHQISKYYSFINED